MATDMKAKLVVEAQTEGQRDITALAGELEALASKGGEAAPRLAELAQSLRSLGSQEAAVKAFLDLQGQVRASETTFKALTREANAYAKQINASGPPTSEEAANLARLTAVADKAGTALAHQKTKLAESTAHMQRHGIATDGAAAALRRIQGDIQKAVQEAQRMEPRLQVMERGWRSAGNAAQTGGQRTSAAAGAMTGSMDAAGQAARRMAGQLAAAFTVGEALRAAQDMEKLRVGLEAVTGSSAKARAEMEFISRLSTQIGADVVATGNAWLGYQAAIKGTAVEGEVGRQVFEAVATSMAKAGKSSSETSNALLALQQIASKGVVSMEELRGQLGEALPGALQAAAKGMGITTQQLITMVESGSLAAQDLFPALTKGLNDLYGTAAQGQTLAQEITNIKNAFVEMSAYVAESGGNDALKAWAERAQAAIVMLGIGVVDFGEKTGAVIGALAARDFSQLGQAFADIEAEGRDKLVKAALHNDQLRGAIEAVGSEADKAALAAVKLAGATKEGGTQAAAAAPNYAALGASYAEVRKAMTAQVELADKEVAASKARGQAAVAEAKLKNDEAMLRQAIGKAASDEANALTDLAQKRQTEVDVLRAELDNKRTLVKANNDNSEKRKKELTELEQLIAKKQIEADTTRGQAAAAQAEARARGEQAQAAQAAASAAQVATTARVAEARAGLSLLETQKSLASQSEQLARMMGNEDAARRFRIEQLGIEVKIINAKAAVQRAEAEGAIAVARATMEELRIKGELTKVKEAELNANIKLAESKLVEAGAINQSARLTEQAIANLRSYGDEAGAAAGKTAAAGDTIVQAMKRVGDATENALERQNSYAQRMADAAELAAWKYGKVGEEADKAGDKGAEAADKAREAHARAGQAIEFTWLSATAQASKYRDEAARHAEEMGRKLESYMGPGMSWGMYIGAWNSYYAELRRLADEYADSLERLDARQQELAQRNSGAARGVEELRFRLLELNGTEEEIAQARAQRERAEVERQIELMQLEIERATLRQDNAAVERHQQEMAYLQEQLDLLGQINNAEKRRRERPERPSGGGSGGGGSDTSSGGVSRGGGAPSFTVNLTANGINDPARLARLIEPELKKMARLAR